MASGRRTSASDGERARRGRASYDAADSGGSFISGRMALVFVIFLFAALAFVGRLVYLQVVVADEYSEEARSARSVDISITPKRGTIYDRNGRVLATSVEATTIYCNPNEIEDANAAATSIAQVLGGKKEDYLEPLTRAETAFAYIKRQADVEQADKLRAAEIPGLYYVSDSKRVYPNGSAAGQIIGIVNIDGEGLTGLENYYDDILAGEPGSLHMEQGLTGIPINGTVQTTAAVPGKDITISIDIDLQQKLEKTVVAMAKDMKAASGQSVVLDGSTGEILAIASSPLLDPTNTENIEEHAAECQCITRAFEPGSIFKSVTMLAALENKAVTSADSFYCPNLLPADEYYVSDAHERENETMTATQILVRSSNVGISLIAKRMGFDKLNSAISTYRLDARLTGVDYPGESAGYLLDFSQWSRIQGYNISFGQGISETPLQMARFYGALANGGVSWQPHFLMSRGDGEEVSWKSETIVKDTDALNKLIEMLKLVVEEGTGTGAQIPGFAVAGKTGTAEYVDEDHREQGYLLDHYNNSFVGFLPDTDSKLVCFVGATEVPSETATTEVFQDIMAYAIERYNINSIQE
ncbi:MAG: penicillin-binding protein 2 [Coriobacteriia bacterium]|nr:penicillin-binding protein 2 [Coriobacteriia bacterium]